MRVKNEKGITIISLLVSIIVMLIIAGVTIGTISSNENRFDEMSEVTKDYTLQSMIESVRMAEIYLKIDSFTENTVFNITTLIAKTKEISHMNERDYEIKIISTTDNTATIKHKKMNLLVNIEIEADGTLNVSGEIL